MKRIGYRIALVPIVITLGFSCAFTSVIPAQAKDGASSDSLSTLRNVRDLAHRLMQSSLYVINDVEQRDMVVTGEPMLVQPQAVFPNDKRAVGWAQEAFDLGPAEQPRRKWIDADMTQLGKLVDLLKEDLKVGLSEPAASDSWEGVQSVAQEIITHYENLVVMCKGPKYDDVAIGKEALAIYDDSKRLEKPWTETLHKVKKK